MQWSSGNNQRNSETEEYRRIEDSRSFSWKKKKIQKMHPFRQNRKRYNKLQGNISHFLSLLLLILQFQECDKFLTFLRLCATRKESLVGDVKLVFEKRRERTSRNCFLLPNGCQLSKNGSLSNSKCNSNNNNNSSSD